jgi:hypothetical protein
MADRVRKGSLSAWLSSFKFSPERNTRYIDTAETSGSDAAELTHTPPIDLICQDDASASSSSNRTIFQAFEWHMPNTYNTQKQNHWTRLARLMPELRKMGVDMIWIPPGCKANSVRSNGYDIYDLYDLGEFDQKGTKETKWGSKEELLNMARAAKDENIKVIWDAVLNHRAGGEFCEAVKAVQVDPQGNSVIDCNNML